MPLNRVHDPAIKPPTPANVQFAAVAIGPGGLPDILHSGVFFVDLVGVELRVSMLHLEMHHRLTCEPPRPGFFWVEGTIPRERARLLARFCKTVEKRYPDGAISYALKYYGDGLTESGEYVSTKGRGLTCSTFVLEIFRLQGLPLLDPASWPTRAGDRADQVRIVRAIKAVGAEPDHVEAVTKEIGCTRFRAEEVAAAATSESLPATFQYAEKLGRQVRAKVQKGSKKAD
jgi:hypothetical protein